MLFIWGSFVGVVVFFVSFCLCVYALECVYLIIGSHYGF